MPELSWQPARESPEERERYAVEFETGTRMVAWWSPERGWTDGLTKLNHVRWWLDLPPTPRGKTR